MEGNANRDNSSPIGQEGLPVIRRRVAGIDVGSKRHHVCGPPLEGEKPNRKVFGTTTPELHTLAGWLQEQNVESVAMESTGVYWIPIHELLESYGFEVLLVDTRQMSMVPGRKTDLKDCQWIQLLHSCGWLRGCFRSGEPICQLRTLVRDKATLVAEQSDWLRRIQKSLDQMNVRVHHAVSDTDGTTGMSILRAIVAGQRDPVELAKLPDPRCRRSQAELAEELSGHWRADHLFSLGQGLKMYDSLQEHIADYDHTEVPPVRNKEKAKAFGRRGQEPLRRAEYRMSGVDLTCMDGVGVETAEVVLSEYGTDVGRFPTEKHFVSHLKLAPRQAFSGGKPLPKSKRSAAATRVSQILRMAAVALCHSPSALGAYYRQIARNKGANVAVLATARKLAIFIYRMLRWGQPYVDEGANAYEERYQKARIQRLATTARRSGLPARPECASGLKLRYDTRVLAIAASQMPGLKTRHLQRGLR